MNAKYTREIICKRFDNHEALHYHFFWGHTPSASGEIGKFVLSQWYFSPFTVEGVVYATAEHWMMAQKALAFNDAEHYQKILSAEDPMTAKKLGRAVRNFSEERWKELRYGLVYQGNLHKFGQHPQLFDYLLSTGQSIIVEASPRDRIWGIGMGKDNPAAQNPHTWRGLNLLGSALMEVRDVFRDLAYLHS